MASLQELRGLFGESDLTEKVEAATIIAANGLISGTPTTDEQKWAAAAFEDPAGQAQKALMAVLAANSSASVAVILAASDTAIQNNVDAVVGTLVIAYNAAVASV